MMMQSATNGRNERCEKKQSKRNMQKTLHVGGDEWESAIRRLGARPSVYPFMAKNTQHKHMYINISAF